jgi:hypothetical protein
MVGFSFSLTDPLETVDRFDHGRLAVTLKALRLVDVEEFAALSDMCGPLLRGPECENRRETRDEMRDEILEKCSSVLSAGAQAQICSCQFRPTITDGAQHTTPTSISTAAQIQSGYAYHVSS